MERFRQKKIAREKSVSLLNSCASGILREMQFFFIAFPSIEYNANISHINQVHLCYSIGLTNFAIWLDNFSQLGAYFPSVSSTSTIEWLFGIFAYLIGLQFTLHNQNNISTFVSVTRFSWLKTRKWIHYKWAITFIIYQWISSINTTNWFNWIFHMFFLSSSSFIFFRHVSLCAVLCND